MAAIESTLRVAPSTGGDLQAPDAHPPPAGADTLRRALAPWQHHGRRQAGVKVLLLLLDVAVFWGCFAVSRLAVWAVRDTSFPQGLLHWWQADGAVRTQMYAVVVAVAIVWMGSVHGHYTASRRRPWWDETRQLLTVIALAGMADAGSSSFRVESNSHNDSWSSSPVGMCAGRWPACAHVHEACLIRRMSPWALP